MKSHFPKNVIVCVGVPCAEKPKIFKEGYSTSGCIGYGLYLIKKIIDVYDWTIEENGEPGKGTKFTITIPKNNKKATKTFKLRNRLAPKCYAVSRYYVMENVNQC